MQLQERQADLHEIWLKNSKFSVFDKNYACKTHGTKSKYKLKDVNRQNKPVTLIFSFCYSS